MTDDAQNLEARRQTFAATDEGRRLLDAFPLVPDHLKPQLLDMIEVLGRWRELDASISNNNLNITKLI